MIVTEQKPFEAVVGGLPANSRVVVVSCNSCTRIMGTGGKEKMTEFAQRLKDKGFVVEQQVLVPVCCNTEMVKRITVEAEHIVVLACDAGVYNLRQRFPKKNIVAALETLGIGVWGPNGQHILVRRVK
jgi:hypothetical protein